MVEIKPYSFVQKYYSVKITWIRVLFLETVYYKYDYKISLKWKLSDLLGQI